ncbi:MAG: glycoside hydrolase family 18 protein [Bacteriovoracia bacterium]
MVVRWIHKLMIALCCLFVVQGCGSSNKPVLGNVRGVILDEQNYWIIGYYLGWAINEASKIDFNSITHLIAYGAIPTQDSQLDMETEQLVVDGNSQPINDVVSEAHQTNTKVLLAVGGPSPVAVEGFRSSTSTPQASILLAQNIHEALDVYQFDGVEIDWEPLVESDLQRYTDFLEILRSELGSQALISTKVVASSDVLQQLDMQSLKTHVDHVEMIEL